MSMRYYQLWNESKYIKGRIRIINTCLIVTMINVNSLSVLDQYQQAVI